MSETSIVTAFFDIGRDSWSENPSLPSYLHRTTDTYFERFKRLAQLENEMFVFTSPEFIERVIKLRAGKKTNIVAFDFPGEFAKLRHLISWAQQHPDYRKLINPAQIHNPEYWSPDYVLVNLLKSHFAARSAQTATNNMLAWVDFGYCRTTDTIPDIKVWQPNFDPNFIHMFSLKQYNGASLVDIIANNDVYITGPCIVASKELWSQLENDVMTAVYHLLDQNLIDDDQTFLLIASLAKPELYKLHPVSYNNWFTVFRDFT